MVAEARPHAGALAEVARPARRARRSGRGRRAPSGAAGARGASSSSIAWLTSCWVSCSSERSPQGASPIVADRRSRIAVSAWLTSSCRSWAMRPRSCSCARSTARPDSRRSSSSRVSMRLNASVSSCSSRAARRGVVGAHAGPRQVDVGHRADEPLHRLEPRAQQQRVQQDRARDRQAEHEQPLAARGVGQPIARHDGGDQRRDAHQQGVDGEDLREERAAAHRNGAPLIGRMRPRLMREAPHARLYFLKY